MFANIGKSYDPISHKWYKLPKPPRQPVDLFDMLAFIGFVLVVGGLAVWLGGM